MPHPGISTTWGAIDFSGPVLTQLAVESAALASGVRNIPVAGREARVPRILDEGTAEWTAEGAEINSHCPDADEVVLVPKGLKNVCSITNEAVDSAEVGVLDEVGNAISRSLAKALDAKQRPGDRPGHVPHGRGDLRLRGGRWLVR